MEIVILFKTEVLVKGFRIKNWVTKMSYILLRAQSGDMEASK